MIQKVKKVAKKKTQQKTNTMRMVEQHKVPYKEYEFAWSEDHLSAESVAESLGIEKGRIFKTLVTVGNKTGPVVAVIPGNQELIIFAVIVTNQPCIKKRKIRLLKKIAKLIRLKQNRLSVVNQLTTNGYHRKA